MILYKDNNLVGKHEMSAQEIADSFVENGDLDYNRIEYYGLYKVMIEYINTSLGMWNFETATERLAASDTLNEIYDTVKARLKAEKLGLWGPKP